MPRRPLSGALLCGLVLGACGERAPRPTTYVERLGSDTFAVESFTRTESAVEGTVLVRSPEAGAFRYRADLADGGRVTAYELAWLVPAADGDRPLDAAPVRRTTVSFVGDSARVRTETEEGVREHRIWAPPGVIPIPGRIPPPPTLAWAPVAAWTLAVRRIESGEPLRLLYLGVDPPRVGTRPSTRWGSDSVGLRVISGWNAVRLEPDGGIRSISGHGTTVRVDIERTPGPLDLRRLAAEYARREARGEGLGHPSPPARVTATVAGAHLEVVYSRPAQRGRRIWGGLVPHGRVWRTGANAATHFRTDRDLELGSVPIPAGRYTLWSLIEPSGARLIVNRQTDQWGTQYDPERDLARIPMAREELAESQERFTMDFRLLGRTAEGEEAGEGEEADGGEPPPDAELRLAWDRTRFTVPIRVR